MRLINKTRFCPRAHYSTQDTLTYRWSLLGTLFKCGKTDLLATDHLSWSSSHTHTSNAWLLSPLHITTKMIQAESVCSHHIAPGKLISACYHTCVFLPLELKCGVNCSLSGIPEAVWNNCTKRVFSALEGICVRCALAHSLSLSSLDVCCVCIASPCCCCCSHTQYSKQTRLVANNSC